jgi:hypothetical protein
MYMEKMSKISCSCQVSDCGCPSSNQSLSESIWLSLVVFFLIMMHSYEYKLKATCDNYFCELTICIVVSNVVCISKRKLAVIKPYLSLSYFKLC